MKILALNYGGSLVKYQLYDWIVKKLPPKVPLNEGGSVTAIKNGLSDVTFFLFSRLYIKRCK